MLKKLASQTAIYGLSSIFGRFLNYLLVPLYTYYFTAAEYGVVSEFYAYAGFFSVFLLCGFETGYFRFRDKENVLHDKTYSTALIFIILLNISVFLLFIAFNNYIIQTLHYEKHAHYVFYFALILLFDAIAAIPFAKLRAENKAFKFAIIKIIEILLTVGLSLFFIVLCPKLSALNLTWLSYFYRPEIGVGYIFIANLIASGFKFLLLTPQLKTLRYGFDKTLFKQILNYSAPLVVIGFAGIINEMLDRVLLKQFLPYDAQTNLAQLGIYSACYKLSILMSLFIQAFRFAAEPFFFNYAKNADAKIVYARVLNFFVIFCVFIFLFVTLFLDFFKYFVGSEFRTGLKVVPILLLANLFLGIYVNLSIWYKLTDKTGMGAMVSLCGAGLTILLNVLWIPQFGYTGSAYATLICYIFMTCVSYILGQKFYPVDYDLKKLVFYPSLGLSLYFIFCFIMPFYPWQTWVLALQLLVLYVFSVVIISPLSKRWGGGD